MGPTAVNYAGNGPSIFALLGIGIRRATGFAKCNTCLAVSKDIVSFKHFDVAFRNSRHDYWDH